MQSIPRCIVSQKYTVAKCRAISFSLSSVLNCQLLNRGGPFGVPIQWLTTAQKIPCWRGDGSRSGPSPCKARRGITPLSSLVTSFIIKSDSIPALWAGAAALFSGGNGLDIRILDVVTICMTGARRIATGGTDGVSEPART